MQHHQRQFHRPVVSAGLTLPDQLLTQPRQPSGGQARPFVQEPGHDRQEGGEMDPTAAYAGHHLTSSEAPEPVSVAGSPPGRSRLVRVLWNQFELEVFWFEHGLVLAT